MILHVYLSTNNTYCFALSLLDVFPMASIHNIFLSLHASIKIIIMQTIHHSVPIISFSSLELFLIASILHIFLSLHVSIIMHIRVF